MSQDLSPLLGKGFTCFQLHAGELYRVGQNYNLVSVFFICRLGMV